MTRHEARWRRAAVLSAMEVVRTRPGGGNRALVGGLRTGDPSRSPGPAVRPGAGHDRTGPRRVVHQRSGPRTDAHRQAARRTVAHPRGGPRTSGPRTSGHRPDDRWSDVPVGHRTTADLARPHLTRPQLDVPPGGSPNRTPGPVERRRGRCGPPRSRDAHRPLGAAAQATEHRNQQAAPSESRSCPVHRTGGPPVDPRTRGAKRLTLRVDRNPLHDADRDQQPRCPQNGPGPGPRSRPVASDRCAGRHQDGHRARGTTAQQSSLSNGAAAGTRNATRAIHRNG